MIPGRMNAVRFIWLACMMKSALHALVSRWLLCQLVGLHTLVWAGGFAKISAWLRAEKGMLARQSLCYIRSHTQRMWD